MDTGKAVGVDKQVAAPTDSFGPKDTIYLSVVSDGVAPAEVLRAKWTFGPKATEFHIVKPSGWPAGNYTVELFVNEVSAGTKQFSVSKAK